MVHYFIETKGEVSTASTKTVRLVDPVSTSPNNSYKLNRIANFLKPCHKLLFTVKVQVNWHFRSFCHAQWQLFSIFCAPADVKTGEHDQ